MKIHSNIKKLIAVVVLATVGVLLYANIIGVMHLFVLFCFYGVYLISQKKRNVRFSGFILSLVGSLIWVCYGIYINDSNVIFQFIGYSWLNVIGIRNNLADGLDS